MTCEELKEMYELYALGLLEDEEREEIDAHLGRGCQACGKSLNEALAMNASLLTGEVTGAPKVAPPRRLKRRILASVGVRHTGWAWAAALAAACMLVLSLWISVQERHRSAELADARQTILQIGAERDHMLQALSFLNQPETQQVGFGKDKPARGNVFANPRRGVLLIASNLPKLGPGRLFEMWVIPKGAAPRPAGMFQSTDSGTAFHMLSGPLTLSSGDAIAVTVEPEAGSSAPTTTPLFVAAF
jgi:Anti-sigma-K factor rskA